MGSERNFRSHYYEKMGFRGVEEKKSLDILLREKPIDLARIQNFCLRFPLPSIYRVQVWQLLVGVMPVHTTSTEYVWSQRAEMYQEMERALTITRKISANTDTSIKITVVWLLERNCLKVSLNFVHLRFYCFTHYIFYHLKHLVHPQYYNCTKWILCYSVKLDVLQFHVYEIPSLLTHKVKLSKYENRLKRAATPTWNII